MARHERNRISKADRKELWESLSVLLDEASDARERPGQVESLEETVEDMAQRMAISYEEALDVLATQSDEKSKDFKRHFGNAERYGDFDPIEYSIIDKTERSFHWQGMKRSFDLFCDSVKDKDVSATRIHWQTFCSHADSLGYDDVADQDSYGGFLTKDVRDQIDDLLEAIESVEPELIYVHRPAEQRILVPELVTSVHRSLIEMLALRPHEIHSLSSRRFEELVAELFARFGYHVELTAQTRDGGRDVIACRAENNILSRLLIECKRFSIGRPVGIGYVRALYGVKVAEKATKAILATTSYFGRDSREFERRHIWELELKDHLAITDWIKKAAPIR